MEKEHDMPTSAELVIKNLGAPSRRSPLALSTVAGDEIADFVPDDARVLVETELRAGSQIDCSSAFEKAGPRERVYFAGASARVGMVTCGGLCPGLNNVIRSIVLELWHGYGVRSIRGYRYGYQGLGPAPGLEPMELTPERVRHIHRLGGSVLGTSRGSQPVAKMVDTLEADGIDLLFTLGGDGTLRGAHAIHEEIARRGRPIAVVGVPKTIDNDVLWVDRTFGFETAVEIARAAIDAAHVEASSAFNGVGLVKLMGRDAGFVAAAATLASLDVNFCLIPEVHFELDGPNGLYAALEARLARRAHAVIVVAEGCGKDLVDAAVERDASGNVRYASAGADIGPFMKDGITRHMKAAGIPITLKYIDPSYMIRGVPANASDSMFCDVLGRHAVHAGMAGKTDLVIGRWHDAFTHVPLSLSTGQRKLIDPDSELWLAVTSATGQPSLSNVPASRRAQAWYESGQPRRK